jgi:hypothetical protein
MFADIAEGGGKQLAGPGGVSGGRRLVERGRSLRAARRSAAKRVRHFETRAAVVCNRAAIASVRSPAAASRMMRARSRSRRSVLWLRTQRSSVSRSSSTSRIGVACLDMSKLITLRETYATKY